MQSLSYMAQERYPDEFNVIATVAATRTQGAPELSPPPPI